MSHVDAAIRDLKPHLRGGETLVFRATVFPGTSEKIEERLSQRSVGPRIGVSFCPERLAMGHTVKELTEVPQIISGSSPQALSHAARLFDPLSVDLVELTLLEAEVATLFLNAWRYVSFGTANQFFHIAASKGLDFDKIRSAIVYRYERASGFPRSGFTAGPRLYQDMMQLAAYCRHTFSLGHAAMLVNETMPDCLVEQARQKLLEQGTRGFKGLKCGILGVSERSSHNLLNSFHMPRVLFRGLQVQSFLCPVYFFAFGRSLGKQSQFMFQLTFSPLFRCIDIIYTHDMFPTASCFVNSDKTPQPCPPLLVTGRLVAPSPITRGPQVWPSSPTRTTVPTPWPSSSATCCCARAPRSGARTPSCRSERGWSW